MPTRCRVDSDHSDTASGDVVDESERGPGPGLVQCDVRCIRRSQLFAGLGERSRPVPQLGLNGNDTPPDRTSARIQLRQRPVDRDLAELFEQRKHRAAEVVLTHPQLFRKPSDAVWAAPKSEHRPDLGIRG